MSLTENKKAADLVRVHWGTFPVIEVILQISVSYAKLELLQEHLILHEIQGIEHIKAFLLNTQNVTSQSKRHVNQHSNRKMYDLISDDRLD